jgi:hypothetical protein
MFHTSHTYYLPSLGAYACPHFMEKKYLADQGSKFLLSMGTELHGTTSQMTVILIIFTDQHK